MRITLLVPKHLFPNHSVVCQCHSMSANTIVYCIVIARQQIPTSNHFTTIYTMMHVWIIFHVFHLVEYMSLGVINTFGPIISLWDSLAIHGTRSYHIRLCIYGIRTPCSMCRPIPMAGTCRSCFPSSNDGWEMAIILMGDKSTSDGFESAFDNRGASRFGFDCYPSFHENRYHTELIKLSLLNWLLVIEIDNRIDSSTSYFIAFPSCFRISNRYSLLLWFAMSVLLSSFAGYESWRSLAHPSLSLCQWITPI